VADFDGDGLSDVAAGQLDGDVHVFWSDGAGFTETTFELGDHGREFFGASAADADGDGLLDLFVAGPGTAMIWFNGGDRTFGDPLTLPLGDGFAAGGTWADYDGDGDLDLYVIHHRDVESEDRGQPPIQDGAGNSLWRNDDGAFVRVEETSVSETPGTTHHARWEDFDSDGDPDLLVLNDDGDIGNPSELWENLGGGAWSERGQAEFGFLENPMGALVQDLDGDGRRDLWITDVSRTRLFSGLPDWGWVDVGLTLIDPAEHVHGDVTWSLIPVDVDADGTDEVFVSYGGLFTSELPSLLDQPDRLYRATGGVFASDPNGLPALEARNARGAARGDFDGDGRADIAVRNIEGPLTLLRSPCTDGSVLVVHLRDDTTPNRFAIGARVTVGARTRTVEAGGLGTFSGSGPELYFGLGDAASTSVSVAWPDGEEDTFEEVCTNFVVTIRRPQ